jgi:hypothetical protein
MGERPPYGRYLDFERSSDDDGQLTWDDLPILLAELRW